MSYRYVYLKGLWFFPILHDSNAFLNGIVEPHAEREKVMDYGLCKHMHIHISVYQTQTPSLTCICISLYVYLHIPPAKDL